jgi:tetratricopeptide (TPR) repeat protein
MPHIDQEDPSSNKPQPAAPTGPTIKSIAAIVLILLAVYGWTLSFNFVIWDDFDLIVNHQRVRNPSLMGIVEFWTSAPFQIFMPITYTWWAIEAIPARLVAVATGLDPKIPLAPSVYHAGNLLLFILIAIQAYRLIYRLTGDSLGACVGSILCSLHPLQVESVCWISENKGLWSTLLGYTALIYYHDFALQSERQKRLSLYILSTLAFVGSLLAKPWGVAIVPMALVIDLFFIRRRWTQAIASVLLWGLLALGVIWIMREVQVSAQTVRSPLATRPYIAADAVFFYLSKIALPVGLGPDQGRRPEFILVDASQPVLVGIASFAMIGLGVATLCLAGYRKAAGGVLLFLTALFPNSGLIPFTFQNFSTVADRYVAPSLIALGLGIAACRAILPKTIWWTGSILIGTIWAGLAIVQSSYWKDDVSLCERAIEIHPKSSGFRNNLGLCRLNAGDLKEARKEFTQSIDIAPSFAPYLNLAKLDALEKNYDGAEKHLRTALEFEPENQAALDFITRMLQHIGQYSAALPYAERITKLRPQNRGDRLRVARLQILSGQTKEGLQVFAEDRHATLSPIEEELTEAQVYEQASLFEKAIKQYKYLNSRYGSRAELAAARLAWLLATAPDKSLRDPAQAERLIAPLARNKRDSAMVLDVSAAVQAALGNFETARTQAERSLELAKKSNDLKLIDRINQRINLYTQNKPYLLPVPELELPDSVAVR